MALLIAAIALLGLAVGSFLNVVIYRVPRGESIVRPGSHCPNCSNAIRSRNNVPLFSWLALRGKCADCHSPISARYPLVELITALLFVGVTVQVSKLNQLAALPAYLFFVAVGIALTAIDIDVRRLPNAIIYPTYVVLAVLFALASVVDGSYQPLVRAVIGGAALYAFYLALAVIHPGGMGFGDVKLAGLIGAVLGFLSYPALLIGAFAAFLVGGVVGMALLVFRNATRKTMIPFGPSMVAGALVAIFASAPLAGAYNHFALHA